MGEGDAQRALVDAAAGGEGVAAATRGSPGGQEAGEAPPPAAGSNAAFLDDMVRQLKATCGLLIASAGLGCHEVVARLCHDHITDTAGGLVLLINATEDCEAYVDDWLLDRGVDADTALAKLHLDIKPKIRENTYHTARICSVNSQYLGLDVLAERIDFSLLRGCIVWDAHQVDSEDCPEAFVLRLIREKCEGCWVRCVTDFPDAFVRRGLKLEPLLRALTVPKVLLWPRFHVRVEAALRDVPLEVVEMQQPMPRSMAAVQTTILSIIEEVVREVKYRLEKYLPAGGGGQEFTAAGVVGGLMTRFIRDELGYRIEKLSDETKVLLSELETLKWLLRTLHTTTSVEFFEAAEKAVIAAENRKNPQTGLPHPESWLLASATRNLLPQAKARLYKSDGTIHVEPDPKFAALKEVMKDIASDWRHAGVGFSALDRGATWTDSPRPTVLVLVKDKHTRFLVSHMLQRGETAVMRHMLGRYVAEYYKIPQMAASQMTELHPTAPPAAAGGDANEPGGGDSLGNNDGDGDVNDDEGEKASPQPRGSADGAYRARGSGGGGSGFKKPLQPPANPRGKRLSGSAAITTDEAEATVISLPRASGRPVERSVLAAIVEAEADDKPQDITLDVDDGEDINETIPTQLDVELQASLGFDEGSDDNASQVGWSDDEERGGEGSPAAAASPNDGETAPQGGVPPAAKRRKLTADPFIAGGKTGSQHGKETSNTVKLTDFMKGAPASGAPPAHPKSGTPARPRTERDILQAEFDRHFGVFGAGTGPQIVVHQAYQSTAAIRALKPTWIVLYDNTIASIRRIETYVALHKQWNTRVYVLGYTDSTEQHRSYSEITHEANAFKHLARARAGLPDLSGVTRPSLAPPPQSLTSKPVKSRRAGGILRRLTTGGKVLVDIREFRSQLPSAIHRQGLIPVPIRLDVADYVLSPDIGVERKSVPDLMQSLASGHLLQQIERLAKKYPIPALLIEFDPRRKFSLCEGESWGFDAYRKRAKRMNRGERWLSDDITAEEKVLLCLDKLTSLVALHPTLRIWWSRDPSMTVELFLEAKRDRPEPDEAFAGEENNASEVAMKMLLRMPGVTPQSVSRIISKYESLEALAMARQEDLIGLLGQAGTELFRFFHAS